MTSVGITVSCQTNNETQAQSHNQRQCKDTNQLAHVVLRVARRRELFVALSQEVEWVANDRRQVPTFQGLQNRFVKVATGFEHLSVALAAEYELQHMLPVEIGRPCPHM